MMKLIHDKIRKESINSPIANICHKNVKSYIRQPVPAARYTVEAWNTAHTQILMGLYF